MTLDQLRVFIAVAEREHLTEGAKAVHLSPSAATAAIQALEGRYGTRLFHRIGRRLELSDAGRAFLPEARGVLQVAGAAEVALRELGGVTRGRLAVAASQTLASHWLPPLLMRFAAAHAGIEVSVTEGNTADVVAAVLGGAAELGCVEGAVDVPALATMPLADDRLVIVAAPTHPLARRRAVPVAALAQCCWVMRERGSGTRAVLEAAMRAAGAEPDGFSLRMVLPTNEAVCAAVAESDCVSAVSELVARPYVQAGRLRGLDHTLPPRRFWLIHHKERFRSRVALAFEALLRAEAEAMAKRRRLVDYDI